MEATQYIKSIQKHTIDEWVQHNTYKEHTKHTTKENKRSLN